MEYIKIYKPINIIYIHKCTCMYIRMKYTLCYTYMYTYPYIFLRSVLTSIYSFTFSSNLLYFNFSEIVFISS